MYGIIYSFLLILVIVYKSHFCKNESASSEGNVPENIRLTADRKDPSGWERCQTCFISKRKLLEVIESEGFCKERIDRFAKRCPDNIYFNYSTIYI